MVIMTHLAPHKSYVDKPGCTRKADGSRDCTTETVLQRLYVTVQAVCSQTAELNRRPKLVCGRTPDPSCLMCKSARRQYREQLVMKKYTQCSHLCCLGSYCGQPAVGLAKLAYHCCSRPHGFLLSTVCDITTAVDRSKPCCWLHA